MTARKSIFCELTHKKGEYMKNLLTLAAAALFVGSVSFAAEIENKDATTVDHSKNPITGTETTTTKTEEKVKDGHGGMKKLKAKKTVKTHKDGKVETDVKVEASGEHK